MNRPVADYFISRAGNTASTIISGGSLRTSATSQLFAASLVAGDLYLVDRNMNIITSAAPLTDFIYGIQALGSGKVKISNKIWVQGIRKIKREAYTAEVLHSKSIGYNATATYINSSGVSTGVTTQSIGYAAPNTYTFTIELNTDFRTAPNRMLRRSYSFTSALASSPAIADIRIFTQQFVDAVNNDVTINNFVIATRVDDGTSLAGIVITALNQDSTFKIGNPVNQVIISSLVYKNQATLSATFSQEATVTKAVLGSGRYVQVVDREYTVQGDRGITNQITFPIPVGLYYSASGVTYNMYSLQWDNPRYEAINTQATFANLLVFCADSAGVVANSPDFNIHAAFDVLANATGLTMTDETNINN